MKILSIIFYRINMIDGGPISSRIYESGCVSSIVYQTTIYRQFLTSEACYFSSPSTNSIELNLKERSSLQFWSCNCGSLKPTLSELESNPTLNPNRVCEGPLMCLQHLSVFKAQTRREIKINLLLSSTEENNSIWVWT